MSVDTQHGAAVVVGAASLGVWLYLLAGLGAMLAVLGGLLLATVLYARTRGAEHDRPTD